MPVLIYLLFFAMYVLCIMVTINANKSVVVLELQWPTFCLK